MIVLVIIELIIICILLNIIKKNNIILKERQNTIDKLKQSYTLAIDWIALFQKRKSIADYLIDKGYFRVIIYGLSDVGVRLYQELLPSPIDIICILDKNMFGHMNGTKIRNLNEAIPNADIIIVASTYFLIEIERDMKDKVSCPIIALDDLIAEIDDRI